MRVVSRLYDIYLKLFDNWISYVTSNSSINKITGDYIEIYDGSNEHMARKITDFGVCGHGINGNVATYYQGTSNEMFIR